MASGLFLRLQAQFIPLKMYGFEAVDREREKAIVERLTSASRRGDRPASAAASVSAGTAFAPVDAKTPERCERYRTTLCSPEPADPDGYHPVLPEEYSEKLYGRLVRSHTFSSRCKQRHLDPHRLCSGPPGEPPDYQPIRDINEEAMRPPTPPEKQQQQQQQRKARPSIAALVGFSQLAGRTLAEKRSPERHHEAAKQRASPFGVVFRVANGDAATEEKPVASTAVFSALGRLRYRAKKEELQQQEREQRARDIRSGWEIVNATEFVRNFERENRRGLRLAVLARPTESSRYKGSAVVAVGCPLCREMPEMAADWQRRLSATPSGSEATECARCGRFHGDWKRLSSAATEAPEAEAGEAPDEAANLVAVTTADKAEAEGADAWGREEEAALVGRLRAPTRASEGGVPFCQRGRRAVGPGLGAALLGFEAQRPKSAIERVRSAQKRKELIDAMSMRLHSGNGGNESAGRTDPRAAAGHNNHKR